MPGKRKFSSKKKSFKKRSFKKRSSSSSSSTSMSSFSKAATSVARSAFKYSASLTTKQPFPDSWKCWMSVEATGYTSGVVSTAAFAFGINGLTTPFNASNGLALIPNPIVAVNIISPTGLKNVLNNPSTNTGVYAYYRVWRTQVEVTVSPQNIGDLCNVAIAPVPSGTNYTNYTYCGSGPNATSKVCMYGASGEQNTLKGSWSIPALFGVKDAEYATLAPANVFIASTAPTQYVNVHVQSSDQANFVNAVCFLVRMRQFVEFFGRIDTQLLVT